jgi:hypothetical protein
MRFHDRRRIMAMLRERARTLFGYGSQGTWQNFSVWEQVLEARERYVRAYYSTRARDTSPWRGRKKTNFMTLQEQRLLDAAESQCREAGVSLKQTRFKRNPW